MTGDLFTSDSRVRLALNQEGKRVARIVGGDGYDPTLLANAEVFERAVAWHFLAILAKLSKIGLPADLATPLDPYDWSDPYYTRVKPKVTTIDGEESRRPNEGIPIVANRTQRPRFGDGHAERYYTRRPERRDD